MTTSNFIFYFLQVTLELTVRPTWMNAAPAPVSMEVSVQTLLMVIDVPAQLDLLVRTVRSTRMTVAVKIHV